MTEYDPYREGIRWGIVRGIVRSTDGDLLPDYVVYATPDVPIPLPAVAHMTNAAGSFAMSLPPAGYAIRVHPLGTHYEQWQGEVEVTLAEGQEVHVEIIANTE
ncbi:MAG: carboxypeptidase regulatory-like domain-containing protein [Streptomyces sp.]|nr:carboxypeptidase regulatory-like domain-containing protein [Streptomyces sp.]